MGTIYKESHIEEDIELKTQYKIKNLTDSVSIREAASENNVDNKLNDFSIIKTQHELTSMIEKIDNFRFAKVNSMLAVGENLTSKCKVDQNISTSESTLVTNIQDNDFNSHNLTKINSITLNTQAVNDNQVRTKSYVNQFRQEN